MTKHDLDGIEALERRLAHCERSARAWRRGTLGLGLGLALLVGLGAARGQEAEPPLVDHLQVRLLEVVDDAGVVLVRLGADENGHGEVAAGDSGGGRTAFLGTTGYGEARSVSSARREL